MRLNKDSLTAPGEGIGINLHVRPDTPVYVDRNETGNLVLNLGPVTIFFRKNQERELLNLLFHHLEPGIILTQLEALHVYDQVCDSKSFTEHNADLTDRLRVTANVDKD